MQTDWSRGRLPLDHSITIKYNEERRAHARRTHALVAQWIECLTPNEKAAGSIPAGRTKMTYPADCQASAPAEALEGHLRSTPTTGESKTKPKWLRTSRLRNCPDDCRARSAMAESWKFLYAVRPRLASRGRSQSGCVRAVHPRHLHGACFVIHMIQCYACCSFSNSFICLMPPGTMHGTFLK